MIIKAYVMYAQYISNYALIYANMPAFALLDYAFFFYAKSLQTAYFNVFAGFIHLYILTTKRAEQRPLMRLFGL